MTKKEHSSSHRQELAPPFGWPGVAVLTSSLGEAEGDRGDGGTNPLGLGLE